MTKIEMLDFYTKVTVSESNGQIEVLTNDASAEGDRLQHSVDPKGVSFCTQSLSGYL